MHFPSKLLFLPLFLLLLPLPGAFARDRGPGVNCHGSGECSSYMDNWYPVPTFLDACREVVKPGGLLDLWGNRTRYYKNEHIMCKKRHPTVPGSVCMFMEGNIPVEGVTMAIIIERLLIIHKRKCRSCGSMSLTDHEPRKHGRLVLNYVSDERCAGDDKCIQIDLNLVMRGGRELPVPWPGPPGTRPTPQPRPEGRDITSGAWKEGFGA